MGHSKVRTPLQHGTLSKKTRHHPVLTYRASNHLRCDNLLQSDTLCVDSLHFLFGKKFIGYRESLNRTGTESSDTGKHSRIDLNTKTLRTFESSVIKKKKRKKKKERKRKKERTHARYRAVDHSAPS